MSLRVILFASLLFSLLFATSIATADVATGVVFEDLNANGTLDDGEPGIEGVAVSNQVDVVLTDDEGRYELPVDGDTVIFITKPSGYAVPLTEHGIPQFYYTHRPEGSPDLHYQVTEPTGPLPAGIDFPLTAIDEPVDFRIVALADTQPETSTELRHIRTDILSELPGQDFTFGVVLGDILFDRLSFFWGHISALGRTGVPFYHVVGNHDLNFDAPPDTDESDLSNETFIRHFGPENCSWDVGQVHFIALDSIIKADNDSYKEGFTERQIQWLRNDLAHVDDDRLIVLCTHSPLKFHESRRESAFIDGTQDLFDALAAGPWDVLAISGHTHYNFHREFTENDGWTGEGRFHQLNAVTVCGSWWSGPTDWRGIPVADQRDGTPNGYTIISFEGADYITEHRSAGFGAEHQMRIYPPGAHSAGDNPSETLLVNVFHGAPWTTVEYSLDNGPFLAMERAPQEDPVAQAFYNGPNDSGKSWVNATVSDHMWQVDLGERLRGRHCITVRVTERDGRVFERSRIF